MEHSPGSGKKPQSYVSREFPGGPVVKNLPANAGDMSSILGQGGTICHGAPRGYAPQQEKLPQ